MKYLGTLCVAGMLILAGSASAQIVNGNEGNNTTAEAPIGTKAGGSEASKQAPGEAAAIKGAKDNNRDAKTMQRTPSGTGQYGMSDQSQQSSNSAHD